MVNILLVEDDYLQAQAIAKVLREHFPELIEQHISTEQEFCRELSHIRGNPPDVIIIDVMLRWTNPSPNMPAMPQEVIQGGYHTAGLRCERRLRELPETGNTPVILLTVLAEVDLTAELKHIDSKVTVFLEKDSDYGPLVDVIAQAAKRLK